MLAQNFKTAEELGLTEPQLDALRKTLVLLETGKLTHAKRITGPAPVSKDFSALFNMVWWANAHPCGTVACIGGTAELIGGVCFGDYLLNKALHELFEPRELKCDWGEITPAQAATALRSYLTTGSANWSEALASRVHDGGAGR